MYEGREDQINWDRIPPDLEDFPTDVQKAIVNYNKFGDKIVSDIGYIGKDFSLIDLIIEVEFVSDRAIFIETLLRLDAFYIEKNSKDMEQARRRAKNGKS